MTNWGLNIGKIKIIPENSFSEVHFNTIHYSNFYPRNQMSSPFLKLTDVWFIITIKILQIRTSEKTEVMTLQFYQGGFTVE